MPPNDPLASPAKLSARIDRLLDVVARLLARRWLREQQNGPAEEPRQDPDVGSLGTPLKS